MSLRACTRVWESSKVKGGSLLVLLAIADYAKDDGRDAFPSTHTLAWKSRLQFRQVRAILTTLQEAGELVVEWNPNDGRRYLHIRCVFENWDVVPKPPKEREAKYSTGGRRKSPTGLTLSGPQERQLSPTAGSPPPICRQPTAGDPLVDPSVEQEHAVPLSPRAVETVDAVEINFGLLLKFTHEVLDGDPSRDGDGPVLERDVEQMCIDRRVPWDRDTVRRAVSSARAARRQGVHGRRQPPGVTP